MMSEEITRKDLIDMEERLIKHIDARTEHMETTLLTEFHKWASPVEARKLEGARNV